jgi:hypothetical protein
MRQHRKLSYTLVFALALMAGAFSRPAMAAEIQFTFDSLPGISVQFDGTDITGYTGTITFPPNTDPANSAYEFQVTSSNSGLLGYKGFIGGTFKVGTIGSEGSAQIASLTSDDGYFRLTDGVNQNNWVQADLLWKDVYVRGVGGVLNVDGQINLGNWTTGGTPDQALLDITNQKDWTAVLTFQFLPAKSLTQLMDASVLPNPKLTNYSGSFHSVPEPSTWIILAGAGVLPVAGLAIRRRRRAAA